MTARIDVAPLVRDRALRLSCVLCAVATSGALAALPSTAHASVGASLRATPSVFTWPQPSQSYVFTLRAVGAQERFSFMTGEPRALVGIPTTANVRKQ